MEMVFREEEQQELLEDQKKLRKWQIEINKTYDSRIKEKVNAAFIDFIDENKVEDIKSLYLCGKLIEKIKKELKKD